MHEIKVAIVGANGKMGIIATDVVNQLPGYKIVAKVGRTDDLDKILKLTNPDIAIELTSNISVLKNTQIIIKNKVRPIVGSSGLTSIEMQNLAMECDEIKLGGLILPNFSLGVACLNKIAGTLKDHFSDFSILEYHHRAKKDKPSGTARHMAQLLDVKEDEIASIRSDGFIAKLQLYANSPFERIMLDHESFDRKSFAPGIILSLKKIMELKQLIIGLENII